MQKQTLLFIGLIIVGLAFSFQGTVADGRIERLSPLCVHQETSTPLERFDPDPRNCTKKDRKNPNLYYLDKIKGKYEIRKDRKINVNTWYNDDFKDWNNKYLNWLAIVTVNSPDFKILFTDKSTGIFVYSETTKNNFAIWVWKIEVGQTEVSSTQRPKELKLVDLIAGDEADRDFFNYLKRSGNFQNSRLPDIIREWEQTGQEYCITAILPNPCGDSSIEIDTEKETPPEEGLIEEFFNPMDKKKSTPQPKCISDITDNANNNSTFNFMVSKNNGASFEVWRKVKTSPPIRGEVLSWYKKFEYKSPLFTWLTIALISRCKTYGIPGTEAIISVCDTVISCYRDKDRKLDEYRPLSLLDRADQKYLCELLKVPGNFESSPLKRLITDKWYNGNKKFKVISYFENQRLSGIGSSVKEDLKVTSRSETLKVEYFLVQEKDGKGYKYSINWTGDKEKDSWYNHKIHQFKDPWIGRLALADHQVKILETDLKDKIFTFIVSEPDHYLWSWKLNRSPNAPEEYAPFAKLLDKSASKNDLATKYAEAFSKRSKLYDPFLKQNIRQTFLRKEAIIRQVFPEEVAKTGDSPFEMMGESELEEKQVTPHILDLALENGTSLQYLVEEKGQFNIYKTRGIRTKSDVWFSEVDHFADPWLAWLCLADPGLEVIATTLDGATRLCMVTTGNRGNLWSWVARPEIGFSPNQYQMINGEDHFQLTGGALGNYVQNLYLKKSTAEEAFYLEKADQPGSFILLDLLTYSTQPSDRVLLWRDKTNNSKVIFRVAPNLSDKAGISINLVEGTWDDNWSAVAKRYQQAWYREAFKSQIARSGMNKLKAWFGRERLGLYKGGLVGVFLPKPKRNFKFIPYSDIENMVDDLAYIPMEKRSVKKPSPNIFIEACTRTNWQETKIKDKQAWRANPLGYFDRVTQQ